MDKHVNLTLKSQTIQHNTTTLHLNYNVPQLRPQFRRLPATWDYQNFIHESTLSECYQLRGLDVRHQTTQLRNHKWSCCPSTKWPNWWFPRFRTATKLHHYTPNNKGKILAVVFFVPGKRPTFLWLGGWCTLRRHGAEQLVIRTRWSNERFQVWFSPSSFLTNRWTNGNKLPQAVRKNDSWKI